jgi:hypothetical protein
VFFHDIFASQAWAQAWFLFATTFAPDASFWWANRFGLLVTGLMLFSLAWVIVANPERRLRAEEE